MEKLQAFHNTRSGHITFGLVELALLYLCASIAIDTANMFAYLASILLAAGVVINFVNIFKAKHR